MTVQPAPPLITHLPRRSLTLLTLPVAVSNRQSEPQHPPASLPQRVSQMACSLNPAITNGGVPLVVYTTWSDPVRTSTTWKRTSLGGCSPMALGSTRSNSLYTYRRPSSET